MIFEVQKDKKFGRTLFLANCFLIERIAWKIAHIDESFTLIFTFLF